MAFSDQQSVFSFGGTAAILTFSIVLCRPFLAEADSYLAIAPHSGSAVLCKILPAIIAPAWTLNATPWPA